MKLNKTKRIFLLALLFLLVSTSVLFYFYYMTMRSAQTLAENMTVIRDKDYLDMEYGKLQSKLDNTSEQISELKNRVVVGSKGTVDFLSLLDDTANKVGVLLVTKKIDEVEAGKKSAFADLSIQFVVTGSESTVKNMLRLMESLPYHSHVESLSVRKNPLEGGGEEVSADIVLLVSIMNE